MLNAKNVNTLWSLKKNICVSYKSVVLFLMNAFCVFFCKSLYAFYPTDKGGRGGVRTPPLPIFG